MIYHKRGWPSLVKVRASQARDRGFKSRTSHFFSINNGFEPACQDGVQKLMSDSSFLLGHLFILQLTRMFAIAYRLPLDMELDRHDPHSLSVLARLLELYLQ